MVATPGRHLAPAGPSTPLRCWPSPSLNCEALVRCSPDTRLARRRLHMQDTCLPCAAQGTTSLDARSAESHHGPERTAEDCWQQKSLAPAAGQDAGPAVTIILLQCQPSSLTEDLDCKTAGLAHLCRSQPRGKSCVPVEASDEGRREQSQPPVPQGKLSCQKHTKRTVRPGHMLKHIFVVDGLAPPSAPLQCRPESLLPASLALTGTLHPLACPAPCACPASPA